MTQEQTKKLVQATQLIDEVLNEIGERTRVLREQDTFTEAEDTELMFLSIDYGALTATKGALGAV